MKIQEYYINGWIKNDNKTLEQIKALGATIISIHIQEENEDGELYDRFVDVRKGDKLWN